MIPSFFILSTLCDLNASINPTPALIFGDLNVCILDCLEPNALTISPELLYCFELSLAVCPTV